MLATIYSASHYSRYSPTSIHQHIPVAPGSKNEVDVITGYHHAQAA